MSWKIIHSSFGLARRSFPELALLRLRHDNADPNLVSSVFEFCSTRESAYDSALKQNHSSVGDEEVAAT